MKTLKCICFSLCAIAFLFSCEDDESKVSLQAEFVADKQETPAGEQVAFTDKSSGNPSRWNWYFEGGTPATSILHSPTVTYENPGTYNVKLVVGKAGDSTSLTKEGFIVVGYPDVQSDFTADRTSAVEGESISFTDASEGFPTSWLWEFIPSAGETLTSTESNPVITFENPGVYTVKLTVSNPESTDEEIKMDYITIIDASSIVADFTSNTQSTYAGAAIQFSDASQGWVTGWNWTFEGGTPASSSEENPVVTYSTPGRYKVTLTASNAETSAVKEIEQYVLAVPAGDLVAFYPFDGSGNDAGPNAVHPSQTGEVAFNGAGRLSAGSAAVFAGNGVLVAPNHSAFDFGTSDFSISCWVKTDNTSRMMIWMESGGINGSGDNQSWLRIGDNTTDRRLRFAVEDNTGGHILNIGNTVSDNAWHHVVCVRSGVNSRVYIDGTLVKEGTTANVKNVSSTQPFKIGAQEGAGGGTYNNYYNGALDDLILYNRALTAAEVTELFNL